MSEHKRIFDDLDEIISEIVSKKVPNNYIVHGIIKTQDGREIEIEGDVLRVLLKPKDQFTEEDEELVEDLIDILEDDQAEIDILIDFHGLKKEISATTDEILKDLPKD